MAGDPRSSPRVPKGLGWIEGAGGEAEGCREVEEKNEEGTKQDWMEAEMARMMGVWGEEMEMGGGVVVRLTENWKMRRMDGSRTLEERSKIQIDGCGASWLECQRKKERQEEKRSRGRRRSDSASLTLLFFLSLSLVLAWI